MVNTNRPDAEALRPDRGEMTPGEVRELTPGEIAEAVAYVALPPETLARVRLVASRLVDTTGVVMALGRRILLPRGFRARDMAGDAAAMATLVHELVHVRQWTQGFGLHRVARDQLASLLGGGPGGLAYRYTARHVEARAYAQQPMERQATMVEDLYRVEHGLPPRFHEAGAYDATAMRGYLFA